MGGVRTTSKKAPEIEKSFKPNRELYIWLLVIAIILMLLCFDIPIIQERWFSIAVGLTGGVFASVLVAWLIDEANCRRDEQEAKVNYNTLFRDLIFVFNNGLQVLILATEDYLHDDTAKKWHEWVDSAYEQTLHHPDLIPWFNEQIVMFSDDLMKQIKRVMGQDAVLLKSGIICRDDIQALSTMLTACELSNTIFNTEKDESKCCAQLKTTCGLIRSMVDFGPSLQPINDIMVEPTIYKLSLKLEQKEKAPRHEHESSITVSAT